MSFEREADVAREAAIAAGEVIARHASAERRASWDKSDDHPVTEADLEANAAIAAIIRRAFPGDAWLSEETADDEKRLGAERVWIIDPLDGTKEFVEGVPEFAVSIALTFRGRPVAACVQQPVTGACFTARLGGGTFLDGERVSVSRASRLSDSVMLSSRTEMKRGQIEALRGHFARVEPVGSVALKLALVAAGRADLWLSTAPKSEWDVCAGDLLVHEAGGTFVELARGVRTYNQADVLLRPLLAAGPAHLVDELRRTACKD